MAAAKEVRDRQKDLKKRSDVRNHYGNVCYDQNNKREDDATRICSDFNREKIGKKQSREARKWRKLESQRAKRLESEAEFNARANARANAVAAATPPISWTDMLSDGDGE